MVDECFLFYYFYQTQIGKNSRYNYPAVHYENDISVCGYTLKRDYSK